MAKVADLEINNVAVELHASHYGQWSIVEPAEDGQRSFTLGTGGTIEVAKQQARTELNKRKVKTTLEFYTPAGERGVATGMHSRNRTVMARIDGGKSEQLDYMTRVLSDNIPPATLKRYVELTEQMKKLRDEQREITKEYEIQLGAAMKQKIDTIIAAQETMRSDVKVNVDDNENEEVIIEEAPQPRPVIRMGRKNIRRHR